MNELSLGKYKALIFDLDGTLVDSSESVLEILVIWCEIHQLNIKTVLSFCHGARIVDFIPKVAPHLDLDKEVKYLAKLEAETTTGLVEIAGAKQFLEQLNKLNITWAIATSGVKAIAELRLRHCGLIIPEVFITSELVDKGKPAPDPFLLTASALSIDPKECLVFEDSDAGIQSAIDAGCDVVAIGQSSSIQNRRIVARVNDYRELVGFTQQQEAV
jgi:sugar-phosphatase